MVGLLFVCLIDWLYRELDWGLTTAMHILYHQAVSQAPFKFLFILKQES